MFRSTYRKFAVFAHFEPPAPRRTGLALVAAAAALTLAAPQAGAVVSGLSLPAPTGGGYAVGCAYVLTATVTYQPETVHFRDLTEERSLPSADSVDYKATSRWTPTVTGSHLLAAYSGTPRPSLTKYLTVEVTGTGIDTGTSCASLPR